MPTFQFAVEITEAVGTQTFAVDADTREEALAKIRSGEGEIVDENIEVQGLAWHTATLVEGE